MDYVCMFNNGRMLYHEIAAQFEYRGGWFGLAVTAFVTSTKLSYIAPV